MLSIVSTPIGNLRDITLRALETLAKCDAIVCEDTRVTGQLLTLLKLPKKKLIAVHSYSHPEKVVPILDDLHQGKHYCLVSDAGTPCISDPGYQLVMRAQQEELPMEVIPGVSAFLAALSLSGLPMNQFTYMGFLPAKKGRQTCLQSFLTEKRTIVFYESPHRIRKTCQELAEVLKDQPERTIILARELTKMYEEITKTNIANVLINIEDRTIKGEYVIILEGFRAKNRRKTVKYE